MSLSLGSIISSIDASYGDASRGTFTRVRVLEYVNSEVRMLRALFDLPTAEYVAQVPLYDSVYFYAYPAGFKDYVGLSGNYVTDDQSGFERTDAKRFWSMTSERNWVAEERQGMQRTLLAAVNYPKLGGVQLNPATAYDGNGTWKAFGGASNVRTDSMFFRTGAGSVAFDLASTGGIYVDDMTPVDLSVAAVKGIASMFLWNYLPYAGFTNVIAQWGSSSANYHQVTATARQGGTGFILGWQQVGWDWTLATDVGVPDDSKTDFIKLTFTCPAGMATQYGIRINDIWMRPRALFNLAFTSDYLVTDGNGNAVEEFADFTTSNAWTLNVPSEFKDFLVFRVLKRAYSFIKPNAMNVGQLDQNLQRLEDMLLSRYPSRREPVTQSYNDAETPTVYG